MSKITNVFVLMLENRSFDHMLGFSGITGTDAESGKPTSIDGLGGTEANSYNGTSYPVSHPADYTMTIDPGHEFPDVVDQLCGMGAVYPAGGSYPPIDNSGFVANYAHSHEKDEGNAPGNFGEIMKCYEAAQLPVLTALAKSFAVCDHWYSSLPGPTWPNRFFAHAASSGGLDHSPTNTQILSWMGGKGFSFPNGTIFQKLDFGDYRIFAGDQFPCVAALHGIGPADVTGFDRFAYEVSSTSYNWRYTFIEPNYGDIVGGTYANGTSQHPLDDVRHGEGLIKATYEAIRSSPHWNTSLLIVTWDEHGGFYDHDAPPSAVAPGDKADPTYNQYGFTFEQYGARVPAVVVSPLIPANTIDHWVYDHSSIPATLENLFGLAPLTRRDGAANNVTPLLSLSSPRTDAPTTLPSPVQAMSLRAEAVAPAPRAPQSLDSGNLPGFLHIAMRQDIEVSPPDQHEAIRTRVASIRTREEAAEYMNEVADRMSAVRAG